MTLLEAIVKTEGTPEEVEAAVLAQLTSGALVLTGNFKGSTFWLDPQPEVKWIS